MVPNFNTDVTVTVDVNNSGYDPWTNYGYNAYSGITSVQIGTAPTVQEGTYATGGTKTVTLGTNGVWSQQFTVSGTGLLSDSSETLPAKYNGGNCFYTISEESVPGYTVSYSDNNEDGTGTLTIS